MASTRKCIGDASACKKRKWPKGRIGPRQANEELVKVKNPEWLDQMEAILETLNEGIIIIDHRDELIFSNSIFQEMIGFPADVLFGERVSKFYTQTEMQVLNEHRDCSMRIGRHRFEFVLPKKDGTRLPVIVSTRSFEDPENRRLAVITFADISEQKRAEGRLREVNTKLQQRQNEIDEDLALAARVQHSLAPASITWGHVRVDSYFHPVRRIGGDFGLVAPQEGHHLDLVVFDVSGHGIGSALVANRLYSATSSQVRSSVPLGDMFRYLNAFVMHNIGNSMFFTAAAARVDREARRMIFAGAGHPPAMLVAPGQHPRLLESRSMVLGALPDAVALEASLEVDLERGDRIVLYTDGITDVFDSRGEMLGVPGVQKFVRETSTLPLGEMKQGILDRVAAWREGPPADDISLVLAEVV